MFERARAERDRRRADRVARDRGVAQLGNELQPRQVLVVQPRFGTPGANVLDGHGRAQQRAQRDCVAQHLAAALEDGAVQLLHRLCFLRNRVN